MPTTSAEREPKRKCCECGAEALVGEPTCGDVECIEALALALLEDLDGDQERLP